MAAPPERNDTTPRHDARLFELELHFLALVVAFEDLRIEHDAVCRQLARLEIERVAEGLAA